MRGGPHFTTLAPHGGKALIEHRPPPPHHGLPMAFPAQLGLRGEHALGCVSTFTEKGEPGRTEFRHWSISSLGP